MTTTNKRPTFLETPIQLDNNLVLRSAQVSDRDNLAQFLAKNTFAAVARESADSLRGPLILAQSPTALVLHNDKIVSTMAAIPQTWYFGNPGKEKVALTVVRLEAVATDPEYRGNGLVKKQIDAFHKWGALFGVDLFFIGGMPLYYSRFGYDQCPPRNGGRGGTKATTAPLLSARAATIARDPSVIPSLSWRHAQTSDASFLTSLLRENSSRRLNLWTDIPVTTWQRVIDYRNPGSYTGHTIYILESQDQNEPQKQPAGFIQIHGFSNAVTIFEINDTISWTDATTSLLEFLETHDLTLGIPKKSLLNAPYTSTSSPTPTPTPLSPIPTLPEDWTFKLLLGSSHPSYTSIPQTSLPLTHPHSTVLQQRLHDSITFTRVTFSVAIMTSFHAAAGSAIVAIRRGEIVDVREGRGDETRGSLTRDGIAWVCFSGTCWVRMVLGCRTASELQETGEVVGLPMGIAVLDALFPRGSGVALLAVAHFANGDASCYANLPQSQFTNCLSLSPRIALHWTVDASTITFGVDVDIPLSANNWVGIGLSPYGGMHGADIWVLLKNATSGIYYIQDSFATSTTLPVADSQQDVRLIKAPSALSTNTVFTFARGLRTCDSQDLEVIQGQTQHIIWAFGQTSTQLSYHGPLTRGTQVLTLYPLPSTSTQMKAKAKAKAAVSSLATTSSLQTLTIQFPNVTVPSAGTSYLCTHVQVPADRKYHVVQFEGMVQSKLIHHMILYGCINKPPVLNDLYECSSMEALCSKFTLAWAPGVGLTVYPADAGFAIGATAIQYFSLQIHYNNPNGLTGVVDNSGMKLYYTSQLRKNDLGILQLGNMNINIPGNSPNYTSTTWNVCASTCTKQFPRNLTVVSVAFHMHTLGFNISTRQIRNGLEITPLGIRNYYDFSFQSAVPPIDPTAVISPGDTLITKCTYLPTKNIRSNTTTFGESTSDEMCFNFVTYYPAMYGICGSNARFANSTSLPQMFQDGLIVPVSLPSFLPYSAPVCKPSDIKNLLVVTSSGERVWLGIALVGMLLLL
ncbi:PHM/PNGase F [Rhizoclosmatium globosum]|uniref:PHM/PNGase F n=1 Tax=Rhizoclosmatium globosum TaxID=329046 RepID=A0A1Y2BGB8_9FUNG|nr:PHM/PNGase F [Rhizoclosmatium globosum]|eukprot:ORY33868.1 PHM/PNGase F [Rhizoclosmatium globosum]